MADLVEKYFTEDLNGAERKALGQELAASEEAIFRFTAKAEEAYQKFGLPEPQWTGPDELRTAAKSGRSWKIWLAGLLAVVAGVLAFWAMKSKAPVMDSQTVLESPKPKAVEPARKHKRAAQRKKAEGSPETETISSAPATTVVKRQKAITVASLPERATASIPALPVSGMKPIDLQAEPDRTYSNLSVEIKWPVKRELVVTVLNKAGSEVTLLYRGPLDAGLWVFDWDGRFVDGRPAGPGQYQIEVKSGSMVQRKAIEIK